VTHRVSGRVEFPHKVPPFPSRLLSNIKRLDISLDIAHGDSSGWSHGKAHLQRSSKITTNNAT